MKKILILATTILFFLPEGCSKEAVDPANVNTNEKEPAPSTTMLGANFNGNLDEIAGVSALLHKSRVEWLRAFVNIPLKFLKKNNNVITGIKEENVFNEYTETLDFIRFKTESTNNAKLIMSLKIVLDNFTHKVPGKDSKEMGYIIEACRKFLELHNLGSHIDILVMGNEPMWENGGNEENYRDYLQLMASKLAEWKKSNGWNFKVFAGALNRVSLLATSNPLIPIVINEVNANPLIDGLDLHIHAVNIAEIGNSLKMVREDFKMEKKIIVTEFSMVWLYDNHMNDNLGDWGVENGYTANMKVFRWLNNAIDRAKAGNPISPEEFVSFFESTEWYPKHWYKTFYDEFVKYKVYCATGRFSCVLKETEEDDGRYTLSTTMWDLNAIYSSKLLGVDPSTGYMNPSPVVYPDYKAIVEEKFGNMD